MAHNREVCDAISAAKLNKAPGIDAITNEVLRAPSIMLTRYLFLLFTVSFSRAQIPDEWRHCQILPLYKNKGSITDPNKYRGIALLTNLYKMYTNIICRRLYAWCDEFAILPDFQHGFRPQRSTETAIQDLTYDIKFCISSKTPFYVCFVDFEKAFDCISRKKLMLKLSKLGCPSQILAVFTDIYKDTQIQVRLSDSFTRKIKQTRGVPQGDRSSPLLFSNFFADLSNYLENARWTVIFYADDLALGSNDSQKLRNAINKLSLFCDHNDISVNIEECGTSIPKCRAQQADILPQKCSPNLYEMLRLPWSRAFYQTQPVPPNREKHGKRKEEYWGFKQNNADNKI